MAEVVTEHKGPQPISPSAGGRNRRRPPRTEERPMLDLGPELQSEAEALVEPLKTGFYAVFQYRGVALWLGKTANSKRGQAGTLQTAPGQKSAALLRTVTPGNRGADHLGAEMGASKTTNHERRCSSL